MMIIMYDNYDDIIMYDDYDVPQEITFDSYFISI